MSLLSIPPTHNHHVRNVGDASCGGLLTLTCGTEIPENDVGRLSYYLKCCVVGCGVTSLNLPFELMDYANAHHLPQHMQEVIIRLTFDEFRFEQLLNRAIFIDDEHTVLPFGVSNAFLRIQTAMETPAFQRLDVLGVAQQLPIENVMLCTSTWLNDFYVVPYLRHCHQRALAAARASRAPSPSISNSVNCSVGLLPLHATIGAPGVTVDGSLSMTMNSPPSRSTLFHDVCDNNAAFNAQCHDATALPTAIAAPASACAFGGLCCSVPASPAMSLHPTILCDHCKMPGIQGARFRCTVCSDYDLCETCYFNSERDHPHTFERIEREGSIPEPLATVRPSQQPTAIDTEDNDDEMIPMAVAVPIDEPKRLQKEDTTSAFVPGQSVRLTGLAIAAMNEQLAIVQERVQDRIIVRVENHARPYSVKPQNLIVVEG